MKKLIPLLLVIIFSCNKNTDSIDKIDYDKAYGFLETSQKDNAFKYFNRAKDNFIKQDKPSYVGSCLVNMAIIQNEDGDYYGSQETALSAIKYLDEKDDRYELSSNYNSLGIAFQNLKEYKKATEFYSLAAKFSQNSLDSLTLLNNRAVAFGYSKKFDSAISLFDDILAYPNLKKQSILYSKVSDNRTYFAFLKDKNYNAEQKLSEALKIRDSIKDNWGLIASYSHLTEYYENKDPEKAIFYANKMLHIASVIKSPDDKINALKKIIFLGDSKNTKIYLKKYHDLNDSLQTFRNKSKSQFALERYDSEKFQRENVEKNNSILKLSIAITALIVVIILIILLYRRRQLKLKQENELEVKNSELKISKKVHDVVANGIYHLMTEIENQDEINRESVLFKLESVYEKSRNISYETAESKTEEPFADKISKLLGAFQSETRKIFIIGNESFIWDEISESKLENIFHILQELMVNMKKHSEANNVVIRFEKNDNQINIYYSDNGIGIKKEKNHKNGLQNAVNRTKLLNGRIIFDTEIETGLKINLSFPVS